MTRLLLLLLIAAPARALAGDQIAVLPLELGEGLQVGRPDVEAAVLRGLQVAGRPVLGPDETASRVARGGGELACRTPDCWSRLGTLTQAAYLVGGTIGRADGSFRVSVRLVRAADGITIATEENQCEVADCSVAELARRSARELVRQTLGPREVAAAPPAPPAVVATIPREEPQRPLWPVFAIGAGAATAGAGIVLLTMHEDCSDDRCSRLNDTLWAGLAVVGVGLAAATVGVVYLVRGPAGETAVALGIGPGGITASGRF